MNRCCFLLCFLVIWIIFLLISFSQLYKAEENYTENIIFVNPDEAYNKIMEDRYINYKFI